MYIPAIITGYGSKTNKDSSTIKKTETKSECK